MPERYVEAIIKYLSSRGYRPLKPRQLARQMGIAEADYGSFREAIKLLRDSGRVVLGARNAVTLPAGMYRSPWALGVSGVTNPKPRGLAR